MSSTVTPTARVVPYHYCTINDEPGAALEVLEMLTDAGINQSAIAFIPVGPNMTELAIFPDDTDALLRLAAAAGLTLFGPHQAILIEGDDALGALVDFHRRLANQGVNIYASTAVTCGHGHFGMLIYVKNEDIGRARSALGI